MPINPLYQFIEPGAGDIEGRNQVLNFLQQDAQRTGMPLNYQRELGNAQEQMNVMEQARPRLNMGPAPMPPAPRPQAPMPRPQMSQPMPAAPQGGIVPPVQIENQPPQSLPVAQREQLPQAEFSISQEPQLPPQAMQTTMAKKIQEGGYDPRLMYAAMAQFAGEFGNLNGRPTSSSAPQFLEAQLALEKQQKDQAFRQQQAEESQRLRQQEMELRYAPKPEDANAKLKYEMIKNQSDAIKSKAQVEQELNDPNSSRTRALKQAYQQATGQTLPDGISGKDVYQIMPMTTRGIESQKSREFQAQQGALNRAAAQGRAQSSGATMRNANELRKEYQNNAVTKTSRDVRVQWNKVREVMNNPSPAGDMAAIFMFMKALDPGSTVREGEYKSAAEATSALGRAETYANNIQSGQKLNPQQRSDFKNIMEKFYRAQMREQKKTNDSYRALAERNNISAEDLMLEGEDDQEQSNGSGQKQVLKVKSLDDLMGK